MAHFAKIENGIVTDVIVVANSDCGGGTFPQSEPIGQAFIASLGIEGTWKQTSYNNNFRRFYAGIGGTYNEASDVFVGKQPFDSWSLDDDLNWEAPTPRPEGDFYWDESSLSWVPIPDAG